MQNFKQITVEALKTLLEGIDLKIIDIRTAQAYAESHLKGALHLPLTDLVEFVDKLDKSTPILVYCYHGVSSQRAAQFLVDQGITEVYSLAGGITAWIDAGYPCEPSLSC